MHKSILTFAGILALVIILALVAESNHNSVELQQLSTNYTNNVRGTTDSVVQKILDESDRNNSRTIAKGVKNNEATLGNFEGPQAHFYSIRHWQDVYTNTDRDKGLSVFRINTFNFDPDHDYAGLPNIVGTLSPVTFYEPETKSLFNIRKYLPSGNEKPYKTYRKKIVNSQNNEDVIEDVEIQLWLMKFQVAVTIMPNVEAPSERIPRELRNNTYPAHWYSGSANHTLEDTGTQGIKLGKLGKETNNYRYNNLEIALKVIPNNAPWYFLNDSMQNERPDIGIGAIYCESLIVNAEDTNRISPNLHKGMALELKRHPDIQSTNTNVLPDELDESAELLLSAHATDSDSLFWNKEYYTKIFFNNIGSWKRNRIFGAQKRADQVLFNFIMPIFVKGSWDIKAPNVMIPDFKPPQAYEKKFPSWDWVPDLGLGRLGIPAAGKTIFIAIVVLLVMSILSPYVGIFEKILGAVLGIFSKKQS